jgi:hypothetical protein
MPAYLARDFARGTHERLLFREPSSIITIDFTSIIQAFQGLRYIGELKQRWEEIKKTTKILTHYPSLKVRINLCSTSNKPQ